MTSPPHATARERTVTFAHLRPGIRTDPSRHPTASDALLAGLLAVSQRHPTKWPALVWLRLWASVHFVKLKLKMSRKRWAGLGVVVLLLIGVLVARHGRGDSSGPGRMDTPAAQACTDFADGYPHAKTKAARLALADKVTKSSSESDNKTIADRATKMGRSASDSTVQWNKSATDLTGACQAAGWKA
jgi:hypothetical protein